MKKITTALLLCLLALTLAGCSKEGYSISDGTQPSGTNSPSQPGSNPSNTGNKNETDDDLVYPTPTPKGNYVGFSLDSGFYEKAQEVTLSCNAEDAKIYYTLDGSTPTENSTLYTGPITLTDRTPKNNVLAAKTGISPGNQYVPSFPVDKANVLRAIAILPDGTSTPVTHATYFVGIDRSKYADVPVISLITDESNLFDYETGIYTLGKTYDEFVSDPENAALEAWQMQGNYTNRGREWERPVSVELISATDKPGFKQDMGMRIMGASTRNQAQKSIRIYAREDYGPKNLKYELIPDNMRSDETGVVKKYKSFVLRIGGNDADFGRLRDPFLQNLVQDSARFETQQNTPCVVFINGEYWGMYTITEDYSDNYFENNYGVDNNNVVLIKKGEVEDGEEDDINLYYDLFNYITGNDMSNAKNYEKACEMLDMGSFADYCAFNLYIYNKDSMFDNNNWRMWRVRTADGATPWSDGKWRMVVYDTDFSTGIYDGPGSAANDNISSRLEAVSDEEYLTNMEEYAPIEIFRSLLQNDTFKKEFLLAMCDIRNIYMEPKAAKKLLDEMAVTYKALMPNTFLRFGPDWIAMNPEGHYSGKLQDLNSFIAKRYISILDLMRQIFDLKQPSKLTLSTNDTALGTVLVNGRELNLSSSFNGMYFPDMTVTVTAVPAEGYKFVGWNVKKGEIANTSAATQTLQMAGTVNLQAIFEKE